MKECIVVFDKFAEAFLVLRGIDVIDTYLIFKFLKEEIHFSFHTRKIISENSLHLSDGIYGVSDIVHVHLSVGSLISFGQDDDCSIIDKSSEKSGVFGIHGLYLVGVHRLRISKNPELIIEEYLSRYDYLKIHFLVNHGIEIGIKKSDLNEEEEGIDYPHGSLDVSRKKDIHDAGKKHKNSDTDEEYEQKYSLIKEMFEGLV